MQLSMVLEAIITALYSSCMFLYSSRTRSRRMQVTVLLSTSPLAILCPEVAADFPLALLQPHVSRSSCSIGVCPVLAFSELYLAPADKATPINLRFCSFLLEDLRAEFVQG